MIAIAFGSQIKIIPMWLSFKRSDLSEFLVSHCRLCQNYIASRVGSEDCVQGFFFARANRDVILLNERDSAFTIKKLKKRNDY
jgi:hypothetical protein